VCILATTQREFGENLWKKKAHTILLNFKVSTRGKL